MLNFTSSSPQDYAEYGRRIWLERDNFTTHEQASQFVVRHLFQEFVTEDGDAQLALVRIFRLTDVKDLPPDIRAMVEPGEQRIMALTGTWGLEEAWQHRSRSKGHQAVPISAIGVPEKIPMFQEVLTQLGIDIEHFYQTKELVVTGKRPYQGTFHIPDASSPAIPAQNEFVRPYGIKSLVGFGGFMGPAQTIYLLYAFSREYVSPEAAQAFYRLQEFVGTTIAVSTKIFES